MTLYHGTYMDFAEIDIAKLEYKQLNNQYLFATQKATRLLKRIR